MDEVANWVSGLKFSAETVDAVRAMEVDGDLLLQLDEHNLKEDLHMTNGINRKRFIRELNNLKKTADYSSRDDGNVAEFLSSVGKDYKIFTYNLIKSDLTPEYMRRLSEPDLQDMLKTAGVDSSIHRKRIIETAFDCGGCGADSTVDTLDARSFAAFDSPSSAASSYGGEGIADVFLSYDQKAERSGELASLISLELANIGFSVQQSADVVGGSRNNVSHVRSAKNFVVVLTDKALDGCIGDEDSKDPLHREVVAALEADCNVIPVIDNFQFPDPDQLPEDMRALCYFNAVRWVHDYQDACIGKIDRFIRGDSALYRPTESPAPGAILPMLRHNVSSSLINFPAALAAPPPSIGRHRHRSSNSGRSTPTRMLAMQGLSNQPQQQQHLGAYLNRPNSTTMVDRRKWSSMGSGINSKMTVAAQESQTHFNYHV